MFDTLDDIPPASLLRCVISFKDGGGDSVKLSPRSEFVSSTDRSFSVTFDRWTAPASIGI